MPIYEYECQTCHHRVELIQKYSDAPLAECPECKGIVKKVIAAPALQFKGSGWYITDYSGKGKEKGTDKPADQKAPESKPATETATPKMTTAEKKSDGEKKSGGGGESSATPSKSDKSEGSGKP